MSYAEKSRKLFVVALTAGGLAFAGAAAANAQYRDRAPQDDFDDYENPPARYDQTSRYDAYRSARAARNRRAQRIEDLARARTRGEEVDMYDRNADAGPPPRNYGTPVRRGYADITDTRYHRDVAESPNADDQRPLRSPHSGHYDSRIDEFDDFGPYADYPLGRSSRGGEDRGDAPGYLTHAGRDSSLANGYRVRGVQEFSDARGQGVRLDDVYPLDPSVNPRRYRGHFDSETYGRGYTTEDEDRDLQAFIRREMMVRPGANLRVSSTGTYDFRHYIDHGNQVNARFRQPAHRRWQYVTPP